MNTYELTIVIPSGDDKNKDRVIKLIADFAKKHKGEINKQDSWGEKHLAYPIKKQATAIYEHWVITLDPADQTELDRTLRIDENILRYMFVRV